MDFIPQAMLRVLLCTILIMVPYDVFGQTGTIQGRVVDAAGQPLPGVNVALDTLSLGAATEVDGSFRIALVPVGLHILTASAIGYRSESSMVEISQGQVATADFVLQEKTLESGEVVVTAARREQLISRVPVSLSVIGPEEIASRNSTSLDHALQYVPGVQMAENQVNIRGSSGFSYNTGSRVLLLLDGIPLLSPDRESVPFNALPLAQVARIEVIKGPGSALYGGGALGGIINVITREFPDTPETYVRLYGGAHDPVRYEEWQVKWDEADTPRPFGGFDLSHARRLSSRLGFWANLAFNADEGYTNFQTARHLNAYTKLGWRPSPFYKLDLLTGFNQRRADAFLYWNGLRDPLNPGRLGLLDDNSPGSPTGTNDNLTQQLSILPSFTHIVSPKLFYAVRGRLFGALIRPLDDDGNPRSVDNGTLGVRYGGEVQLNWNPHIDQFLTAGITGDALATQSSFFQDDEDPVEVRSQPEGAVFTQWEQTLLGRLDVVAGLRYDFYFIDTGDTETKLSPKLNVALPLAEEATLRASFGQGFRVPSLAERFVNNRSFFPVILNLGLRPEESTGYEIGLRNEVSRYAITASFDIALFWNDYERLVEPIFIPAEQAFQFVNLTRARVRGTEAVFDAHPRDERWSLRLGYTFLDADDLTGETAAPLVYRSQHLLKASCTVHPFGSLQLGADFRFASAFERIDSDFSRFVPDADLTLPIRVLDARVALDWQYLRVSILAENLLDYYYVERPAFLAPPRRFMLQVQGWF